ncbi:MAG: hypothetical protein SGJ27_22500 [Candidatus Melainabacteria bacterium]|nr:hypothetical protein [Candidatus Melainabacteria bacterium]
MSRTSYSKAAAAVTWIWLLANNGLFGAGGDAPEDIAKVDDDLL